MTSHTGLLFHGDGWAADVRSFDICFSRCVHSWSVSVALDVVSIVSVVRGL